MAGKGLKPNTLLPWSSSLFIEHEVTRGSATSPGRDAILSQLYSPTLPSPSPSATVFFHILPSATTAWFYWYLWLFFCLYLDAYRLNLKHLKQLRQQVGSKLRCLLFCFLFLNFFLYQRAIWKGKFEFEVLSQNWHVWKIK